MWPSKIARHAAMALALSAWLASAAPSEAAWQNEPRFAAPYLFTHAGGGDAVLVDFDMDGIPDMLSLGVSTGGWEIRFFKGLAKWGLQEGRDQPRPGEPPRPRCR